ncbi:MAG: glycosyltransferase family 1 protein [Chryseolinea sp.]
MGKGVRVVLDNIIFFLQRSGGGSVYWSETISRLDPGGLAITYTEPRGRFSNIFYQSVRPKLTHTINRENMGAKILSFFPYRRRDKSQFIFHSSYYRVSSNTQAINIVTIHDFMPELFFKGFKRLYHSLRKRRAIMRADGIICVSENTRLDMLRLYPQASRKNIVTIHLGISTDYYPTNEKSSIVPNGNYVLFVGRRAYYKNFTFAVDVVGLLDNLHLVIVGESLNEQEKEKLSILDGKFTVVENPSNDELNRLYNHAICLLYPSSYEGFGIPVLEAMATGCVVVALNTSSIPEISNGAAVLIDTLDATRFSDSIRMLQDQEWRNELVKKGVENAKKFTWEESVRKLCEFYTLVHGEFTRT